MIYISITKIYNYIEFYSTVQCAISQHNTAVIAIRITTTNNGAHVLKMSKAYNGLITMDKQHPQFTEILQKPSTSIYITFCLISSEFISSDLILSRLSGGSEFTVKEPSLPWKRPVRRDNTTYFVPTDHSHGKLGRFTVHSMPLSSDDIMSSDLE